MNTDLLEPPEPSSPANAGAALDRMTARLEAILEEPMLSAEMLVEITAIFNNTSYVFLYLEANDDQASFDRLLTKRDALYKNPALDRRILAKLADVRFDDPKVERSRRAYADQLSEKLSADTGSENDELARLKAEVQTLEEAVTADRRASLERLGLAAGAERASTLFYHLISRTTRPEAREKLDSIWAMAGARHRDRIAAAVDRMIALRRRGAVKAGATPLALTLRKCRIDETQVAPFLERYLALALPEHDRLEAEIRMAVGVESAPIAHFSYYLRHRFGGDGATLFDLDACLHFIFDVAKAAFGLEFSLQPSLSAPVIVTHVSRNGEAVGKINLDLWINHGKDMGANHTLALRNRGEWGRMVQHPEAWVSCRFDAQHRDQRRITFQNVHSLFHEFGHAINHLLVDESIPNVSGLEYLPLERLEYLSMWFEKWAYHPSFADHLGLSERELHGLGLCQLAKKTEYRRTYVERAVTSLLDFECHRRADGTLRECFDDLDAKWGITRYVRFAEFPAYFSWPMFMAHPGANFAYLWGAGWSAAHIRPLQELTLSEIAARPADLRWCEPCFRVETPSTVPEPADIFAFYGEMGTAAPMPDADADADASRA